MATGGAPGASQISLERTNYGRLCRAIVDLGTDVLRDVLNNQIAPVQIQHAANRCRSLRLNATQKRILNTAQRQGYVLFDVSLLYTLIRNLCPNVAPTHGWSHGTPPGQSEITEGDDVERIHFIRNNIYGHLPNSRVLDTTFNIYWQILKDVTSRTDVRYNTQYGQQLLQLEMCCMDEATEAHYIQTIKDMEVADKELRSDVQQIQRQLQNLTELQRLGAENQDQRLRLVKRAYRETRNALGSICSKAMTNMAKSVKRQGSSVSICKSLVKESLLYTKSVTEKYETAKKENEEVISIASTLATERDITKAEQLWSNIQSAKDMIDRRANEIITDAKEAEKRLAKIERLPLSTALNDKLKIDDLKKEVEEAINKAGNVETFQNNVNKTVRNEKFKDRMKILKRWETASTLSMINDHRNDKTFLCTKAVTDGLKTLENNGVLIYSGVAGSGKSSNSLEVAKQFLDSHPNYVPMSVNKVTKWESYVCPRLDTLAIFDDFLGSTNVDKHVLQEQMKYWKQIYTCINSGKLKVILTTRDHMLQESLSELETNKLFVKKHIINLSSENYELSHEEKQKMFKLHGEMNKIRIVYGNDQENFSSEEILNMETTVIFSKYRVEKIIRSKTLMGFPQALFLFCSDRKYTRLGERFFLHPSQNLVNEMDEMKISTNSNKKLQYCILVYLLLHNNEIDSENLDDQIWSNVVRTFQLKGSPNHVTIKGIIDSMTNTYITNLAKTYIYKFKHETILEAVAVSMGNSNVKDLLKYCDKKFIFEFIRTKHYIVKEGEVIVMLKSTSAYACLGKRFLSDLMTMTDKYDQYHWISHPALDDPDFVSCFIDTIQSNDEYVQKIRDCCSEENGLFYMAFLYDKCCFVDTLYTQYHQYIKTDGCLKAARPKTTQWLLDHQIDVDNTTIGLNVIFATTEKFNVILSHKIVELKHLARCIDRHDLDRHDVDVSTVKIILDRWPNIEIRYVMELLLHVCGADTTGGLIEEVADELTEQGEDLLIEKFNSLLSYPAFQLKYLTKYLDRHNVPRCTDYSTVKRILDRWPDIDITYVNRLLLASYKGTTEDFNAVLSHPAVQLKHLTRYIGKDMCLNVQTTVPLKLY